LYFMASLNDFLLLVYLVVAAGVLTLTSIKRSVDNNSRSASYVPATNLRVIVNHKPDGTVTGSRTLADLRYLTLGSSNTYGVGLTNRYSAYPFLLSPNPTKVSNIAVKQADVAPPKVLYPSVSCIKQSINELYGPDEEFDVIVLEHDIIDFHGLYNLAQIMRTRYPDAIIILLCVWAPAHFDWYVNNERRGTFYDWANSHNVAFYDFMSTAKFHNKLDIRWPDQKQLINLHKRIENEFNTQLLFYLHDDFDRRKDPKECILQYTYYFQKDHLHLTQFGHRGVVQSIQKIVNDVAHHQSNILLQQPRVGTWLDDNKGEYDTTSCPSLNEFMQIEGGEDSI